MMDKGYWGQEWGFVSFEYVPKYFQFMSMGKCEIKANIVSEEITFLVWENNTDMPLEDMNYWVPPQRNKDGMWYLLNLI